MTLLDRARLTRVGATPRRPGIGGRPSLAMRRGSHAPYFPFRKIRAQPGVHRRIERAGGPFRDDSGNVPVAAGSTSRTQPPLVGCGAAVPGAGPWNYRGVRYLRGRHCCSAELLQIKRGGNLL